MNFQKSSERGGFISNPKIYVADFCHYKGYFGHEFRNKSATWFSENEGGVKGRLELFRKFIRFGMGMLPLGTSVYTKGMNLWKSPNVLWPTPLFGNFNSKLCQFSADSLDGTSNALHCNDEHNNDMIILFYIIRFYSNRLLSKSVTTALGANKCNFHAKLWQKSKMVFNVDIVFWVTGSQTAFQSQGVDDCVEPVQKKGDIKVLGRYQARGAQNCRSKGPELGLPCRRPHRLGDLVSDGPVVASHVHRRSLVGKKVLQSNAAWYVVIFERKKTFANLALQHFLQDLLLSLSKLLGQRLHSRVNIGKPNFWEQQNILLVNTLLPARLHLFWQVPPPSKEQGRNCCLCCRPLSPAQGRDILSLGEKQDVQWTLFSFLHRAEIFSVWGENKMFSEHCSPFSLEFGFLAATSQP